MPPEKAEQALLRVFASRPWAARVAAGRPYRSRDDLMRTAEEGWNELEPRDWQAAMASHPRIGERGGDAPQASAREQRRAMEAPVETLTALAAENLHYEQKFGHVFLIFASGRSAEEILGELRRRIKNDPDTELVEARGELRRIAQRRLEILVTS
jgi:OHCU decarboxylase